MFPLRDENPTERTSFVTFAFIAINVAVWLLVQGAGVDQDAFLGSLCRFGTIPGEVTGAIPEGTVVGTGPLQCRTGGLTWSTVVTSMFLHGGWFHLIGNMWFLWVFGNNIEDSTGHVRFVLFYLLCGALASAAHIVSASSSGIPTVGASGAISGVMGAYALLYPKVRVQTLIVFVIIIRIIPLPAWMMLGYWFLIQVLSGGMTPAEGGGVAYWAHIGGFVAGLVLVKLFDQETVVEAKRSHRRLSRDELDEIGWF